MTVSYYSGEWNNILGRRNLARYSPLDPVYSVFVLKSYFENCMNSTSDCLDAIGDYLGFSVVQLNDAIIMHTKRKNLGEVIVKRSKIDSEFAIMKAAVNPNSINSIGSGDDRISSIGGLRIELERKSRELHQQELQLYQEIGSDVIWRSRVVRETAFINQDETRFVNRRDAVDQIMDVFLQTYDSFMKLGPVRYKGMAVIHSARGNGKTTLAYHLLESCLASEKFSTSASLGFRDSLLSARMIRVDLRHERLMRAIHEGGSTKGTKVLTECFLEQVDSMIRLGVLEGSIASFRRAERIEIAVTKFIDSTQTPLLLFLDDVGRGFRGSMEVAVRENLMKQFFMTVLYPLLDVAHLYVVVAGEGDALEWIGSGRHLSEVGMNLINIDLNLIREQYIERILKDTMISRNSQVMSLKHFYGINTIEEMQLVRDVIMRETNGHPLSLRIMLKSCLSIDSLLSYQSPVDDDMSERVHGLVKYQFGIQQLVQAVDAGIPIDMAEVYDGISLAQLADKIHIRWEGPLRHARVYATESMMRILRPLFLPFRGILAKVRIDNKIYYNYFLYWEHLLLSRFQEVFRNGGCPRTLMPAFFNQSLYFGNLKWLLVSQSCLTIPKITDRGQDKFTELEQPTLKPIHWRYLLSAMNEKGPFCFFPYPQSASSDAFIFAEAKDCMNNTVRVKIGIAAKCITSRLSRTNVNEEKHLFNRMFAGTNDRRNEMRILIICSSGGFASLGNHARSKDFPHIDETILIDLSTREKRTEFFGIHSEMDLIEKLEFIVANSHAFSPGKLDVN